MKLHVNFGVVDILNISWVIIFGLSSEVGFDLGGQRSGNKICVEFI